MAAEPSSDARGPKVPEGEGFFAPTSPLCKCPHCGGLDVSYLGRGLDICATCHGQFICEQRPIR